MTCRHFTLSLFLVAFASIPDVAHGAEAAYHHVHLTVPNPEEAAQWYIRHMGCQVRPERKDACQLGMMYLAFRPGPSKGGSDGSAVNHIGISFADLTARMKAFEAAGIKILTPMREAAGLFKLAFVEDPWGTRIEVVEDPEYLGFHHIHLHSTNPDAALKWYQTVLGGQNAKLKGRLDGVRYGTAWLLAARPTGAQVAPTEGRAIDHLAFSVPDLDRAAAEIKVKGIQFSREPWLLKNGPFAKASTVMSPDGVRVEIVQP